MIINNFFQVHRKMINSLSLSGKILIIGCRPLTTGDIIVRHQGPVVCIGINRPEKKNCLTPHLATKLLKEIESLENNDSASVGVLYGERGTFSYGIDPNDLEKNKNIYEEIVNTGLFEKFPRKPIVAAVNGYAVGLAFDLALWCDFRVTEDTAVLASYARNAGIPVSPRLVDRLLACVGSHRALDWLLTGRQVKPKEALEAGVVTRLVACGTGLGQAVNFAHSLANVPQSSLRAARALIYSKSDKFENKNQIHNEWEVNHRIALKEVLDGLHVTQSGDVRQKEWR